MLTLATLSATFVTLSKNQNGLVALKEAPIWSSTKGTSALTAALDP